MSKKYIEVNDVTRRYLRELWRTDIDDIKILRGLSRDREAWARFNSESPENKRKMFNFMSEHKLRKFKF